MSLFHEEGRFVNYVLSKLNFELFVYTHKDNEIKSQKTLEIVYVLVGTICYP